MPRVGSKSVAKIRSSVDLPAPFAPSSARASPWRTSKERPDRATAVGFSNGCKNVRQPLRVGGNDFSTDSIAMAASSGTQGFIACLLSEDKCGDVGPAILGLPPEEPALNPTTFRISVPGDKVGASTAMDGPVKWLSAEEMS